MALLFEWPVQMSQCQNKRAVEKPSTAPIVGQAGSDQEKSWSIIFPSLTSVMGRPVLLSNSMVGSMPRL